MKRYVIFNHPIARIGFEQRESDNGEWVKYSDAIEAVQAENEACAMVCEQFVKTFRGTTSMILIIKIAKAIRARGK